MALYQKIFFTLVWGWARCIMFTFFHKRLASILRFCGTLIFLTGNLMFHYIRTSLLSALALKIDGWNQFRLLLWQRRYVRRGCWWLEQSQSSPIGTQTHDSYGPNRWQWIASSKQTAAISPGIKSSIVSTIQLLLFLRKLLLPTFHCYCFDCTIMNWWINN